jgi:D-alanyl-D-alanine carboxypeptidase
MAQTRRRRRRRRLNKNFLILVAAAVLLLVFLVCGIASCDTQEPEEQTNPSQETPGETENTSLYGWQEENGQRYYVNQDGTRATGWLELEGKRYLLDEAGYTKSGWIQEDGKDLYLKADGSVATGKVEIDGKTHFFTSAGAPILLVNPWNYLPEDYAPDLVPLGLDVSVEGSQVDRSCYDALVDMINGCNAVCPEVTVISSFRSVEYQVGLYNKKVQYFRDLGYGEAEAKAKAATIVAVPGTSEHHTGLAVDIIDTRLWALEEEQADLPAQQWLMENSWRYGFILRYPDGTTKWTGIIYEPWHYRYVGRELAAELYELDLCLEEYLDRLTKGEPLK